MAKLINKMLNFVGWEGEEEQEVEEEIVKEEFHQPNFLQNNLKKSQNKVVNLHTQNQFKVVIFQPEKFDEAQNICDHLKTKKPIVVNLEDVEKEEAQRIVDFLSGAVYSLDGNIQKISTGIFLIAPHNVDIMSDLKEEFKSKAVFPWAK